MKRINQKTFINYLILFILILNTSCNDDFLDKQPLDQYGENAVWRDLAMAEHFLNDIYWHVSMSFDRPMLGALTDEMLMDPGSDYGQVATMRSLITPSDLITFDRGFTTQKLRWENVYRQIRACNMVLTQLEERTYTNEALRDRIMGEAHFLRAHYYHNLVFLYGGVPLVTKPFTLADDFNLARNTFEETINFIVDELDKAAALLPLRHAPIHDGRATKGSALSLKARVLLFAASDLYNSNVSYAPGYGHPELVGYTGGDRTARWQAAKDAARVVIDLGEYSLHKAEPAPGDSIALNYTEIFISDRTSEDIYVRNFSASNQMWTYNIGIQNLPVGYYGWGNGHVTGAMVDAYQMSNGEKFDWNKPEHMANPYQNREPRFYADIYYDGSRWRERTEDVKPMDPIGIIQTGRYEQEDGTWREGLDATNSPISTWTGTHTSYYLRKFQNIAVNGPWVLTQTPWRFIRYAEILLSYAEASVELGQDDEARAYLNMIRKRAGLPDINTSGNELLDDIRHERKIELMMEDKRFYDIRRWMIAPDVTTDVAGVDIRYYYGENKPTYNLETVSERLWRDRFYFLPIKMDEMNRNDLLIQNPNY